MTGVRRDRGTGVCELHIGSLQRLPANTRAIHLPFGVYQSPPSVGSRSVPTRKLTLYTALSKTARDRMLSVVRVATIFLPRIEIAWCDPSAAMTGNTESAFSASVAAPVIPVS
jgi:hypothetical protein